MIYQKEQHVNFANSIYNNNNNTIWKQLSSFQLQTLYQLTELSWATKQEKRYLEKKNYMEWKNERNKVNNKTLATIMYGEALNLHEDHTKENAWITVFLMRTFNERYLNWFSVSTCWSVISLSIIWVWLGIHLNFIALPLLFCCIFTIYLSRHVSFFQFSNHFGNPKLLSLFYIVSYS